MLSNMKKTIGEIKVNNKKYPYILQSKSGDVVFVECKAAKISQDFLKEDIGGLLIDLPNLILAEKEYSKKASELIQLRVTPKNKRDIEKRALKEGFDSVSAYVRSNLLST